MSDATQAENADGVADAPSLTDEEMLESVYVPPVETEVQSAPQVETPAVEPAQEQEVAPVVPEKQEAVSEVNPLSDDEVLNGKPAAAAEPKKEETAANAETDPAAEKVEKPTTEEAKPVDYKAFHDTMMAPFKANGKTIELRTPEEAIQLMKMGANYTRKMQEIAPHRKMLTMLQKHELDETRLSYLIDLDKKNPEAIKQLIKEANIDPLDIDVTIPSAYQAGNHIVSDDEVLL